MNATDLSIETSPKKDWTRPPATKTPKSDDPNYVCAWYPQEPNGWIVNFSLYQIVENGKTFGSTEHYYQADKFKHLPELFEAVRTAPSPRAAKDMTYKSGFIEHVRPDWDSDKDNVMLRALQLKAEQHPDVLEKLLATGDKIIAEDSPKDSYWGCGSDGRGKNRVGEIWMQIRNHHREGHA